MSRKLMLTVDVEAQPGRASESHVDRLIWGQFANGRAGVSEMMDIADRHRVKLTMFVDWCEHNLYGEAIDDVGREIARRKHDAELHMHASFLPNEFWFDARPRHNSLLHIDEPTAAKLTDYVVDRHIAATQQPPLAFRGGSYEYNSALLRTMRNSGIRLNSNVNTARSTQPVQMPQIGQFRWSNGIIEVPISTVQTYKNVTRLLELNLNSAYFASPKNFNDYLDVFWNERGNDAIACLVMHSWSFLTLDQAVISISVETI